MATGGGLVQIGMVREDEGKRSERRHASVTLDFQMNKTTETLAKFVSNVLGLAPSTLKPIGLSSA